jgi:hypothetical protein
MREQQCHRAKRPAQTLFLRKSYKSLKAHEHVVHPGAPLSVLLGRAVFITSAQVKEPYMDAPR